MDSSRRIFIARIVLVLGLLRTASSSHPPLDWPPASAAPVKSPVQGQAGPASIESAFGILQASAQGIPIDTAAIEVQPH